MKRLLIIFSIAIILASSWCFNVLGNDGSVVPCREEDIIRWHSITCEREEDAIWLHSIKGYIL